MVTLVAEGVSPVRMVYSFLQLTDGKNEESRLWFFLEHAIRFLLTAYLTFVSGKELVLGHGDLYEMVNALSTFAISFNIFTKVVTVLLYLKEIRQLFDRVEHLHMELRKDEDHRHIILDMERFSKIFILFYKISLMIYPFYSFITNFIIDYKTDYKHIYFTLKLLWPWRITNLWLYTPGTLLVLWVSLVSIAAYVSFTALELVFTFEIQAFSRVLRCRLENMNEKDVNIYGLHRDIIKLVTDFNALFSGPMYMDIVISSVEPCGYGFSLIKAFKRKNPAITEMFYKMILVVSAPFILCACGQQISSELEILHEACYMIPWYEQTPQKRKNLIQMMTVTKKPSTINFKGIIVFNYSCFSTVAQGIYTYMMMIVNFDTEE